MKIGMFTFTKPWKWQWKPEVKSGANRLRNIRFINIFCFSITWFIENPLKDGILE